MFEDLGVFLRIGEATDIVTKEMYDFEDKGGRHLALRPGADGVGGPSLRRAPPADAVEGLVRGTELPPREGPEGPLPPVRPGRASRSSGVDDPYADVEVIALAWRFYEQLGLRRVTLLLNSLGDGGDRDRYADVLRAYLEDHRGELSDEAQATIDRNPLRVLDAKRPQDRAVVAGAPLLSDHISPAAAEHFDVVQEGLRALDIPFTIAPQLVRGLDYYRRTTFEFAAEALDAAQNAVGGGGRYDGLVEELGGPADAGDRLRARCRSHPAGLRRRAGVPAARLGGRRVRRRHDGRGRGPRRSPPPCRRQACAPTGPSSNRSMKSQMKAADRSGAALALLVGSDEQAAGTVTVRVAAGRRRAGAGARGPTSSTS